MFEKAAEFREWAAGWARYARKALAAAAAVILPQLIDAFVLELSEQVQFWSSTGLASLAVYRVPNGSNPKNG